MMRKKGAIVMLATLMVIILCGAVSAADSSTSGGEGNLSDSNTSEEIDPILWVTVNYEYTDDVINPEITVTDSNDNSVTFNKTKYSHTLYQLNFTYSGVGNGTLFNVMVKAPGYITQTQQVEVNQAGNDPNFYGTATFNMQATENYKLGRKVTAAADALLKFTDADDVLCITTAGITHLNGATTEDCLEGILNGSHGLITYGQGNLLNLQKSIADPVDFCFIVRNGSELTAAFFKNGTLTPAYVGTFSETMTQNHWNNFIVPALGDDSFGYVSLANAWTVGLFTDTLRQAAFHGHVCIGTISGQAMIQTLLKYYPPGELTDDMEATSYAIIGVPGGSDDDVFVYSMDATPGKRSYIGFDTDEDSSITGFIRWCKTTKNGTLVIMKFDEQAILQKFKDEKGFNAYSGISSELQFNKWMVEKLQNNPESLVTILYAFDNLNETQFSYLTGYEANWICTEAAHGLDMDYILSQPNLVTATAKNMNYVQGTLTAAEMKQIGVKAAQMAIDLFKAMEINLEKDDFDLKVLTSAGYARLNGQATDMTWDGIYEVLGSRISRSTLLPVHSSMWTQLWFEFFFINGTNTTTKTLLYNSTTGNLTVSSKAKASSIATVTKYDPPFDILMAWLFHNHVCEGSVPGFFIANSVLENYPLSEGEKYIYVSTSNYCDDDTLMYLLGLSPGTGTYYNQRLTTAEGNTYEGQTPSMGDGNEGLLIRWNEKTGTGTVTILTLSYPWAGWGAIVQQRYSDVCDIFNNNKEFSEVFSAPIVTSTVTRPINRENLNTILTGKFASGNALQYAAGLPLVLPVQDGSGSIPGGSTVPGGSGSGSGGSNSGLTGGTGYGRSSGISPGTVQTTSTVGAESTQGQTGKETGGKAHEVTKVSSPGSTNSNIYMAIGGVILIGFLVTLGIFKNTILGFLGLLK